MDNQNWLMQLNRQMLLKQIRNANQHTEKFGLCLSEQDTEILIYERNNTLKIERRLEFNQSVIPQIIYTFCDSAYITQSDYVDTLVRLQEIFFLYKNEMHDEISDEELLNFMKEQFDGICYGDLDYLEGTCLRIFSEAIRAGYRGYVSSRGKDEFSEMDIVTRWDKELYLETLKDLCWR